MADKVDEDKKLAASLMPVTKTLEKTNKKAPPLPAVQLVCLWALLTAAVMLGSLIFAAHVPLPSWLPKGTELTDAEAAEVCAIIQWMLWCSATQAAAAALALLLPARRRWSRRVLAKVALAATTTSHLMFARIATLVVTTDLGDIFLLVVGTVDMSFLAAGDIICFLALLGRGAYANAPAC